MLRTISPALILTLLLFGSAASTVSAAPPTIYRSMEIIKAAIEGGTPETVDPAWSYDFAARARAMTERSISKTLVG